MKNLSFRLWNNSPAWWRISLAAAFAVIVLAPFIPDAGNSYAAEKIYTIAVVPRLPVVTTHVQWTPFVDALSARTGLSFKLKLYDRMSDFEQAIGKGEADFIFASPIQTVVAHQMKGYIPLLRGSKAVSIGLFVRNDSPVKTIQDLTGKPVSFVGNKNLCSVYIRYLLEQQGESFSFFSEYSGSTKNVIKSVILGKSAAGAVFIPELERESEENRSQLRSITETPKIAPHPLSANPSVPAHVREAVKRAALSMAADVKGSELLRTIMLADAVASDYDRDYRQLELIDIKKLAEWGR